MKNNNSNNALSFNKAAISELNDQSLVDINGGSTPPCAFVASIALSYAITKDVW
ncbi:class I lanthipeptide [Flavobacterium sp. GCM10027622]|uniref:class I lanthipeptide n=1 Tax=unclassified Flavobacterium TaxID=196869 RepID=UPI00360CDE92